MNKSYRNTWCDHSPYPEFVLAPQLAIHTQEMLLELKNHLSPPVHATPALHKIDSESAWDNTQSFSQPYRPSARVRQLEKMMGVDEGRGDVKQHETMPMDSLRMMVRAGHLGV